MTERATACMFMMDVWIHGHCFLIAFVKRDAFTLFVRVIALYKTSVLLLLLLLFVQRLVSEEAARVATHGKVVLNWARSRQLEQTKYHRMFQKKKHVV